MSSSRRDGGGRATELAEVGFPNLLALSPNPLSRASGLGKLTRLAGGWEVGEEPGTMLISRLIRPGAVQHTTSEREMAS